MTMRVTPVEHARRLSALHVEDLKTKDPERCVVCGETYPCPIREVADALMGCHADEGVTSGPNTKERPA